MNSMKKIFIQLKLYTIFRLDCISLYIKTKTVAHTQYYTYTYCINVKTDLLKKNWKRHSKIENYQLR